MADYNSRHTGAEVDNAVDFISNNRVVVNKGTVATPSDLPLPTLANAGWVYYVNSTRRFSQSNGSSWVDFITDEAINDVVRYDEEELSGDVSVNADQLDGHRASYFAKQSEFEPLQEEVAQNTLARHTHSNKSILDLITQTMIDLIGTISGKYVKPDGGIPKDDLDENVKASLAKADNALQAYNITYTEVEQWQR